MSLPDDGPPIPAVGYCRVSTDKQSRYGKSMEAQKQMIAHYCSYSNLALIGCVEEPGVSAGKKIHQRPGLVHVLDMVEDGKVGAVVVLKLDRMFRSVVDAAEVLELLKDRDVGFHSVVERWDTSTPMGEFQVNIVTAFAQMERKMAGERTKTVLRATKGIRVEDLPPNRSPAMYHRAIKGKLICGMAPYGYEYASARIREAREVGDMDRVAELEALKAEYGELIPVPKELAIVKFIKDARTRGKRRISMNKIAIWVNLYGYRTRRGTRWDRRQVSRVLNRHY